MDERDRGERHSAFYASDSLQKPLSVHRLCFRPRDWEFQMRFLLTDYRVIVYELCVFLAVSAGMGADGSAD